MARLHIDIPLLDAVVRGSSTLAGTIEASIDDNDTTLEVVHDSRLDALDGSGDYIAIVLDPEAVGGPPEIVYATDYDGSGTLTISRGEEGTTARAHASSLSAGTILKTQWQHCMTAADLTSSDAAAVKDWAMDRNTGSLTISVGTIAPRTEVSVTLAAAVGDVVFVAAGQRSQNVSGSAMLCDIVSVDPSDNSIIESFTVPGSTVGDQNNSLWASGGETIFTSRSTQAIKALVADEIISGQVTIRLGAARSGSNKGMDYITLLAINFGQPA